MNRIIIIIVVMLFSITAMAGTMESINKGKAIEVSGFDCAVKSTHMIEWLGRGKDFRNFIVADVEHELYKQQPGSQLLKLECTGEPELLTRALPENEDDSKAIVTTFSATFPLKATVINSGSIWILTIDQNYFVENLNIPSERKLTQKFNVKSSAKQ